LPDADLALLIGLLAEARDHDRQVFLCGNGGSAAAASHFAVDLGKGASLGRSKRFRVISLVDTTAWLTALANDLDYSQVFVEPLKNLAAAEDLLVVFSGSGNSPNVVKAVGWANEHGLITVALTGRPGGRLGQIARHTIFVESSHMGRIEDGHLVAQHVISYYFMEMAPASQAP
jgi:D-sedoheptulose 7-phosphate isomerase